MRVLLSSVFGPFGVDDAYGRKENLMELFHNQVTREQGLFSLRFNHQSFGLHFIAANIEAPTLVLDFPSEARFVAEVKKGYEYVGISFIVPNFAKAKRMAELVRRHAPQSRIVLGGHGTAIPDLTARIDCDHVCRGEGVRYFRRLLGEDPEKPLVHPSVPSAFAKRVAGVPLRSDAAVLAPGVGCPNGCRFCATSHFFGKRYVPYFDSGAELFSVCQKAERELGVSELFVMDENFLKRPERARELLRLMEANGKLYTFGLFSSAETIANVGVEFLARLGVSFLWLGVESKREVYEKNRGIDLKAMIAGLRSHGISVLASGILFLEHHDHQTIWEDIKYLVDLDADFVQFMGLGPMPGTRLYEDYEREGRLRHEVPFEEWHGQRQIWFRHPNFTPEESERFLRDAFRFDHDTRGASLMRMCDTTLRGYRQLARYKDPYMARRRAVLGTWARRYRPILSVLERYAHNEVVAARTREVASAYEDEFGPMGLADKARTQVAFALARREAIRVAAGRNVYQPRTFTTAFRLPLASRLAANWRKWVRTDQHTPVLAGARQI